MRINSFFLKRHFWLETTSSHLEDNKKIWRMEYKGIALSSKWNWKHNSCLNQRNVKTALWCLGLLLMWPEHQSEPGKWQNDGAEGTHRSRTSNQTRVAKQEKNNYASGSVQENLERLRILMTGAKGRGPTSHSAGHVSKGFLRCSDIKGKYGRSQCNKYFLLLFQGKKSS